MPARQLTDCCCNAKRLAGLIPAGSLTYNSLRIRSGRPAGLELSTDYIPLEVGLWDEISFQQGLLHRAGNHRAHGEPGAPGEDAGQGCAASMAPAPAPIYARGKGSAH